MHIENVMQLYNDMPDLHEFGVKDARYFEAQSHETARRDHIFANIYCYEMKVGTVETRYNEILGTEKFCLLYQIFCYISSQ